MSTFWQLIDFEQRLDRWLDLEQPEPAVRITVARWIRRTVTCDTVATLSLPVD